MDYTFVQQALRDIADPEIAEHSQRFFKTGEGDKFLGIRVPKVRGIAKEYKQLSIEETEQLLHSDYHEERLCALILLVNKMGKADEKERREIYELYLDNTEYINNWDLVDTSAEQIVGRYLTDRDRTILYELAKSDDLWERRIAIMSTFHFIKNEEFEDTLSLAELLLDDEHDLIHKAVGWMLREVGNRNREIEEKFLDQHVQKMPRTMLRYAIEKFTEDRRQHYLQL